MIVQRILTRLKINVGNVGLFTRYLIRRSKHDGVEPKAVFFDIDNPRFERYLYWLLKMFDIAGWRVSLRASPNLLLNLRNFAEYIYDIQTLDIRLTQPKDCDLVISNKRKNGAIFLDTNYFQKDKPVNSLSLPFFMFPEVYHQELDRRISRLRSSKRNVRCFLRGSSLEYYDNPEINSLFGILNRYEITKQIGEYYRQKEGFMEIEILEDADKIVDGVSIDFLLLRNSVITLPKWIELLSKCSFFIAPPGFMMPFSHNLYEAMAVGCIPITQYGKYFSPPLVNGETCFSFSDIPDLKATIDQILGIDEVTISRMRENVVKYYDTHLDPKGIVEKIENKKEGVSHLYIIAGHLSVHDIKNESDAKIANRVS